MYVYIYTYVHNRMSILNMAVLSSILTVADEGTSQAARQQRCLVRRHRGCPGPAEVVLHATLADKTPRTSVSWRPIYNSCQLAPCPVSYRSLKEYIPFPKPDARDQTEDGG